MDFLQKIKNYNAKLKIKLKSLKLILFVVLLILITLTTYAGHRYRKNQQFIKVQKTITGKYGPVQINGFYKKNFEGVFVEFEKNFLENDEAGASVCVTEKGKTVVDLWGGFADVKHRIPWEKDTVSIIFSSSKGVTAFVVHMLASRGLIDLDAHITDYWPEFGQNGKEKTTVRMILNHTSGLPVFAVPLQFGDLANWDYIIHLIEEQEPYWTPGTIHAYQAQIYGFVLGEIVRRVTGKTIGTVFREEIALPLGIDFSYGLPQEEYYRAATIIPAPPSDLPISDFVKEVAADPNSIPGLVAFNDSGLTSAPNDPIFRTSDIPATNGFTNARALAKLYMILALGGEYNGTVYITPSIFAKATVINSAGYNHSLMLNTRFALGFSKSSDNRHCSPGNTSSLILSKAALGHAGFGGSLGFADPVEEVSFAYVMNQIGPEMIIDSRCQNMVDAVYQELGYISNDSGCWVK